MSIGVGGILGATLMLGLGIHAAAAQTAPAGAWTDPPARSAAPASSGAASPAAPVREPAPVPSSASPSVESPASSKNADATSTAPVRKAEALQRVRQAAKVSRKPVREVRRTRPPVVAEAPRRATPRPAERHAVRPAPRRVIARAYTPRSFAPAPPYPYAPLPVGRVVGPVDGERNPIFAEGDDRTRRIAAAQAAGYLVVRARSVQYPDGRMMRSYRPYDEDDGID